MQVSSLERECKGSESIRWARKQKVKWKHNLVLPLAQLLKHLMSDLSEGSYAELIILKRHKIPLGNLWAN